MASKQELIELLDLKGAMKRAHKTGERASQQFTKLLGVVHGGLGVTLAAWLQRLFEAASDHALSPLAYYLAVALVFAALGLLTLGLAAIYDQLAATEHVKDVQQSIRKIIAYEKLLSAQKLEGENRAKKEDEVKQERADIENEATDTRKKAKQFSRMSVWIGIASWLCAVAAFTTVAIGIFCNMSQP